jgi:hypothetical protein
MVCRHAVRYRVECFIQRHSHVAPAGGISGTQRNSDAAGDPARGDLLVTRSIGRRVHQPDAGLDVPRTLMLRSGAGAAG